jgi:hypothetical protein
MQWNQVRYRRAMSPRGSLATKPSLDDPYPSTTPDMVDVAAHLAVQPSVKLYTHDRACAHRQGQLDIVDEQELE